MLFPAGILVILLLGALAVDSAATYLAQRELENQCASLANDISTKALDESAMYSDSPEVRLNPRVAEKIVDDAESAINISGQTGAARNVQLSVQVDGDRVTVAGIAEPVRIFGTAVPDHHNARVAATSTAQAVLGR